ncbi:DNA-binding protein [Mesorhizobium sp. L-8-10]|uniref:ImmA/IrrE family metallo-endopeptidase n=1 Tax=Mesorhizobium sp. L-8-10 TaxID=2744523 RepID=UPI001925D397|nr:ImmA/IrrE family metallo-endopeptidase [Mesorhizobium sp. L-8-10]BCH28387.1 DNA-binding protein [Mesorhizobium sp. L-8-10]
MAAVAKKERPSYNPAMLRWARERRGQSIEEVAHRLKQKPERIVAWEEAREVPTVNQARALADLYHRSFIEFFLKEPLELPEAAMVPDFRTHRGVDIDENQRALKDIQSWAEAQRANALDLFQELGEEPPVFPEHLFATVETRVESAAVEARKAMDFTIDAQLALSSQERAQLPNILRRKLEQVGILTLKDTSLGELGARGMCLVEFPLPTVVFGNEAPSAQAFTLAHELAHVVLRQSGIIAPLAHPNQGGKTHTEAWCDQFAASFLMPKEAVIQLLGEVPARRLDSISDDRLSSAASAFRVSPHAMLIRLVHLGYVDRLYYWEIKKPHFDQEEANYRAFGRASYYGTRYKNALGDLYTGLVMEAWANGRITNHNAAQYMGIKNLQHLYDIRDHFGVP